MRASEEFTAALRAADCVAGFSPLPDEQEFSSFLKEAGIAGIGISVLADRDTDPAAFAASLAERYAGKRMVILVPGRRFDASGTRHGRGGGWYDRFLSRVPREWVRAGVLSDAEFSNEPLRREPWDEPMDFLLVKKTDGWNVLKA
jgi:hypothetical protein